MKRTNDIAIWLETLTQSSDPQMARGAKARVTLMRLCVAVGGSYTPQGRELRMAGVVMAQAKEDRLIDELGDGVFTITQLGRSVVSALRPMVA
jgi:hypothetical protein